MKKVGLVAISLLFLNFVSAAYGSFTSFSFDGFINNFDTSLFIIAIIFLGIFWVVQKSLTKANLIQNGMVVAVISFGVTAFAMYGILQTNVDFGNLLSGVWLPEDFVRTAVPIVLAVVALIMIFKLGFGNFLMIVGAILIAIGLLDLVYSKGLAIAVGIIFFLIGAFLRKKRTGKIFGAVKSGLGKVKDGGKKFAQGSADMARLTLDIDGRKYKAGAFAKVKISIPIGAEKKIFVVNPRRNPLVWKAKKVKGVSIDNTGGTLVKGAYSKITVRNNLNKSTKRIILIGRGQNQFKWQKLKIIIED